MNRYFRLTPPQFCLVTMLLTVSGLIAVASLNYAVNPYAQYASRAIPPIVQTSRTTKLELLRTTHPHPNALVLGSSRVMKLEPSVLSRRTGYRFFNAGVNFAKPEDLLTILRYYQKEIGEAPRMVIVGIDSEFFGDGLPMDARLVADPALSQYVWDHLRLPDKVRRYQELISWQQTVNSLKSLRHHATGRTVASDDKVSYQDDGKIVYANEAPDLRAQVFPANLAYNQREYEGLHRALGDFSWRRLTMFREFLETCRQAGTRVVLFMTPLHPELRSFLDQSPTFSVNEKSTLKIATWLAKQYDVAFVDLSRIESFDGDPAAFIDGVHPLESNTRKMIQQILAAGRVQTQESAGAL